MRIAMLSPIACRTAPECHGRREKTVSLLTEGLVRRGIEVILFATHDSETKGKLAAVCPRGYEEDPAIEPKVWEALHISELFERGEEFDLIHSHLDYLPLTYARLISTPVVTTLYGILPGATLPIYRKYNGQVFYVSTSDAERHPELDYIAAIHHGLDDKGFSADKMVEDYLRVYEKIQSQRHREDHRPWGYYRVLEDRPDHKVKRLVVYPGKRLSLQRHQHRAELWQIIQGRAIITRNNDTLRPKTGQAVDIPIRAWHRIENPGTENLVFIEVQTGDYFGEDDIERKEDDFGRM
jgi:mannose-6-phosphate isomerase-like protein (cupin superfamily)